jgi:GDP-D-mannose dehydratase
MRIAIGNCYKTKEEAEQVVKKMKVMAELKRLADKSWKEAGVEIDWSDDNISKYFVRYDPNESYLLIDHNYSIKNINDFYFRSEEKAKEAIDKIGEDRLKSVFKQN